MKKYLAFLAFVFCLFTFTQAQEYADFEITSTNQGTGTFSNVSLSNFTWIATGTIKGAVQILNDEVFDDGNAFENTFGPADNAENLRMQIIMNGTGSIGQPIISKSKLSINFDKITPDYGWGFCLVDLDVENCLISAIDQYDNAVANEDIADWLIELFDANLVADGLNIPKWDATHATLLGSDTPEDYLIYNDLVIGGMDDSEAAAAFFMPNIPLKSVVIDYENLQADYNVSFHFYIASQVATEILENVDIQVIIYPNPVKDKFKVQGHFLKAEAVELEIYDLYGRKILNKLIPTGTESIEIDVSHLQNGVFCFRIISDNKSVTQKLIIQK